MTVPDQGLGLAASVELAIGRLGDTIRDTLGPKLDGVRQQLAKPEAIFGDILGFDITGNGGVGPSSGNLVFQMGGPGSGPAQGHIWFVRSLRVGGALFTGTPAGTAYVVRAASPPNMTALVLTDLLDLTSGTFPQRAFYGRGELLLTAPQKLFVVITAPTNGTQYTCACSVEDVEQGQGLIAVP